jgi:adenylate cyclase class 2
MHEEIEATWTDINVDDFRRRLKSAGAKMVQAETLMRRKNYDEPTPFAVYRHGWVRVRDEGNKVTLAYKKLLDRTINGTIDITVVVDSFDKTCAMLEEMTLRCKSYQETLRETWQLGGAEITIDTWPWIPTFTEIEALDEPTLWAAAAKLGLPKEAALHGSVENIYLQHYDVTEEEVDNWPDMRLGPVPEWLERKRRP